MFLRIVPVSNVPQGILEKVRSELESLNIKCRIMPSLPIPEDSYNQWRKQYNAEVILKRLSDKSAVKFIDKNIPTLMITDADLYYGRLNFVFGLEDPSTNSSVVSITRLRPEFYDERPNLVLLEERTVKEVLHELGHYLGLGHCSNVECVMSFSPSAGDIDAKQKYFCESCKITLMTKGVSL
jgi:archaemetzincin